jgi:xanthosine utilization system XapX-like protein
MRTTRWEVNLVFAFAMAMCLLALVLSILDWHPGAVAPFGFVGVLGVFVGSALRSIEKRIESLENKLEQ